MQTNVFLLPDLINPDVVGGSCCVIIDVLRATTTIVTAFANGARSIIPCLSIEHAIEIANQQQVLLGGERDCVKPEAFDLGNSPAAYSRDVVKDIDIAFTTTNGTKAMLACTRADKLLLAAFSNLTAITSMTAQESNLNIICSGTNGEITLEDVLLAGAIVHSRTEQSFADVNDQATLALNAWEEILASDIPATSLLDKMKESRGGRNLLQLDKVADIQFAANIDTTSIIPTLNPTSLIITASN
ncbi:MAG: 2-phosphosulfolactate phosphatase [Planctomycetaceae bacterium]|jgi:2-phosphosulfolactate phosphatase|nr:2-phosphosulfolactate phosphatase [Planctomycetaceae bacterium]